MSRKIAAIPADYADWLADIKARVASARQRAALAANAELIRLYWQIGRDILERQAQQGWGSKVIERLARDLRAAFPEMKGFSRANLLLYAGLCRSLVGGRNGPTDRWTIAVGP